MHIKTTYKTTPIRYKMTAGEVTNDRHRSKINKNRHHRVLFNKRLKSILNKCLLKHVK